jgi:hypothetical protein
MHPDQRSADGSAFQTGRLNMFRRFHKDETIEIPVDVKEQVLKAQLTDTFHYLLAKGRTVREAADLYTKASGKPVPFRLKLKSALLQLPVFHNLYFKDFDDRETASVLQSPRGASSCWFKSGNPTPVTTPS